MGNTEGPAPSRKVHPASWQTELAAALRDPVDAARLLGSPCQNEAALVEAARRFPVRITPHYARLIDPQDPADPLARMVLPDPRELDPGPGLQPDPLAETLHMPVPRLVHRYRDRALLLATLRCASYCRHCTRRRLVGRAGVISPEALDPVVEYLRGHPEIRDLLISGGDPLVLSDRALERILRAVRAVPSIQLVRIGTRVPAVLPSRITPELVRLLTRFQPLYISTHFNHPRELNAEAVATCQRLADAGLPLVNQTVLLAGVNDRPEIIEALCWALTLARVRPYYLLQSDLVEGVDHLRTPLTRGLEIMETLRGRLSGLALPTFVVDGPDGSGKIPLLPNYMVSWSPGRTVLRNFEGVLVVYPDPAPAEDRGADGSIIHEPGAVDGVAGLLHGARSRLTPAELERAARQVVAPTEAPSSRNALKPLANFSKTDPIP